MTNETKSPLDNAKAVLAALEHVSDIAVAREALPAAKALVESMETQKSIDYQTGQWAAKICRLAGLMHYSATGVEIHCSAQDADMLKRASRTVGLTTTVGEALVDVLGNE